MTYETNPMIKDPRVAEDQEPNPVHIMRAIEHLHSQAVAADERMVIRDYLMAQHRKYNEKAAQVDASEIRAALAGGGDHDVCGAEFWQAGYGGEPLHLNCALPPHGRDVQHDGGGHR